jgi:hypothetical protein
MHQRFFCLFAAALLVLALSRPAAAATPPTLLVRSPQELAAVAREVENEAPFALGPAMRLTGFEAAGDVAPIVVALAPESSALARTTPSWVAGFAGGTAGPDGIVIFPARADRYPDAGLLALLRHEVTHVLVHRAAGGREVPRWFNEGLAMAAAGETGVSDRARIALAVLRDATLPIARLDRAFAGGESAVGSAYALAGDVVRSILEAHGADAGARILARIRDGATFEEAFHAVAGTTLDEFESDYWSDRTFWDRWVPIFSSSALLWGGISLLAIGAFRRRRARDVARLDRWDEEERAAEIKPVWPEDWD